MSPLSPLGKRYCRSFYTLNHLSLGMFFAKFGQNCHSGSGEKDYQGSFFFFTITKSCPVLKKGMPRNLDKILTMITLTPMTDKFQS